MLWTLEEVEEGFCWAPEYSTGRESSWKTVSAIQGHLRLELIETLRLFWTDSIHAVAVSLVDNISDQVGQQPLDILHIWEGSAAVL